jgi:hypothetical protein
MNATLLDHEAQVLSRTINPNEGTFAPDAARALLTLRFTEIDRERVNELAAKAREGSLTAEERAILDGYEHVGFLLELLKSKARLSLKLAGEQ